MSRIVPRLLGASWRRMTSPSLLANQKLQLLASNHQCPSPARLDVLRAGWYQLSVRLFQRWEWQCLEASGSSSSSPGAEERLSVEGPSVSDGPQGTAETDQDGSMLADLDIGKTYIQPSSTDSLIFGGIPFYELPVIHIKATYNNTHINVTDHTGRRSFTRSTCGAEGFKNAKKGTTIAAQTVGIAIAAKAKDKGLNTVRIMVKGIGPGRQASIKGLQMGGLDIVSITDVTPTPHNGCRPRKARRL
ncbi:28S ribosomal protein S11, mitochondrial-like [Asterias rubens]|uniref:28S ribosomal protein S11, mitochondrial-like n=1 Tax=Asterias rubens TaxID=7604 RepID=UPI001455A974|nr:28S ribosomal protein S11, mitochondrial-like [Asterias rubens]XP_033634331.1 28S ribosomal protein S11, mitochondrial-like [Asterias rubens]XP_033634332.1 28S ribosomal protein S11, mitochondrial-like [Asterias rubens]